MSAEDHGHRDGPPPEAPPAAPSPVPTAPAAPRRDPKAPLRELKESDYTSLDPDTQAELSHRIDLYYNTPLDIFPFSETHTKPDRFHVLFERQIDERFPDDDDVRDKIRAYGRSLFHSLLGYTIGKRLLLLLTLIGLGFLASQGPAVMAAVTPEPALRAALAGLAMAAAAAVFVGVLALIYTPYRFDLENRSYRLSREIVQRTRELQNLYTNLKALPDQSETLYAMDGPAWGKRSSFLVRLVLWMGARLEYLEKFIQVETWRVRRERYWMNWLGGFLAVAVLVSWAAPFLLQPAPPTGQVAFRVLQGLAVLVGLVCTYVSWFRFRTPADLVRTKLGSETWIRYASLDLDDTIGDQVRRDKERLVEYRSLTRGR